MNIQARMFLRCAVGGYLVYLAYEIIKLQVLGGDRINPFIAYGGAAMLGLCGIAFCVYAIWNYLKDKKAADAYAAAVEREEAEARSGGDDKEGDCNA